jgi:hypothetical protein
MKTRLSLIFLILCMSQLPACGIALKVNPGVGDHLQSWIDAPLESMKLPLAPYDVVFHLTDDAGVSAGEVSINGDVVATLLNPEPANLLVTFIYPWSPQASGDYIIRIRAQGTDGSWGDYAEVKVTVGEVTPTITPTITPTVTPTVTPVPAGYIFTHTAFPSMFQYQHDCVASPSQVTIQVTVSNPERVYSIVLFYRLKTQSGNIRTQWNDVAMNPKENGVFTYTISWKAFPDLSLISSDDLPAWLMYQFFATNTAGDVIGQSEVYLDVAVESCQ